MTEEARARAERRRQTWSQWLNREGWHRPADRVPPHIALGTMWDLAQRGWALMGHELPSYDRTDMPANLTRRGPGA